MTSCKKLTTARQTTELVLQKLTTAHQMTEFVPHKLTLAHHITEFVPKNEESYEDIYGAYGGAYRLCI